ncbi:MAG: hypothetical protein WB621_01160 [Candidatus Acidiferrales bacterium]
MAASQQENGFRLSATRLLVRSVMVVSLCGVSAICLKAQDAPPNNTNESWKATTQTSVDNNSPSRMTESYTKTGNRSVDKQSTEVLGPNGQYQPNYETETETIQVNATTTRTVVRTYKWDVNGQRDLEQVTEEEARSLASGDTQVVRTTSNSDGNGNLRVLQREVADTRNTSPDAQETKTTLYLADGNGTLTPSVQTQELQRRNADHSVEVKKTLLQPDSSGSWVVGEVKESTIRGDDKNRISEESTSRADSEGRLSEVLRTVAKEKETGAGERSNTVDTYSTNVSGLASDGSLHRTWQVTTVRRTDSGGKTIEQQSKQPNPDDPNSDLQVTTKTKYIVRYDASGTQQTKTIQARDINGVFHVVSFETGKSDQLPAEQGPTAPSDKPE